MDADEPVDALTRSVLEGVEVDWVHAEEEAERALARVRALQRDFDEEDAPLPDSGVRISPPRPRPL